jgi:non-homologous end joining protein Ku
VSPEPVMTTEPVDLMQALMDSIAAAKAARKRRDAALAALRNPTNADARGALGTNLDRKV